MRKHENIFFFIKFDLTINQLATKSKLLKKEKHKGSRTREGHKMSLRIVKTV